MKNKFVFATNNLHKLEEVRAIFSNEIDILSLKEIGCDVDIPETGTTLEENALIKARFVKDNFGFDCFADDTGLEVEALNFAPGVYSARYAGEDHNAERNVQKLLTELAGVQNRKARFRTVIAFIRGQEEHLFDGQIDGEITLDRRGKAGFGYDPVFQPSGYFKTFAEMGEDEKNKISHRAVAVSQFCQFLQQV